MTNELPLISVIIPAYKVEKYLDRCVNSVVNQTYKNLEIILVDDGSPDNCPSMCDEWTDKDSRIKVIHKENGGLSSARNAALDIMNGEYLTFVDSDDYIDEKMIEILYNRLINDGTDLAHCNRNYVDDFGLSNDYEWANSLEIKDEVLNKDDAIKLLVSGNYWLYIIACSKLYKRFLFDDFRYPLNVHYEDERTTHLIFDKCNSISIVSDKLYNYYKFNSGSITQYISTSQFDVFDSYAERMNYFLEKKLYDYVAITLDFYISKYFQLYKDFLSSDINAESYFKNYHNLYRTYFRKTVTKANKKYLKKKSYIFYFSYKLFCHIVLHRQ